MSSDKCCHICLDELHDEEQGIRAVITTSHEKCMPAHMHYQCWTTWNEHHPNECVICRKKSIPGNTYTTWNPLTSGQPHITVIIGNDSVVPQQQERYGICYNQFIPYFCGLLLLCYFIAAMVNSFYESTS